MTGQTVAYVRVSSADQRTDRQREAVGKVDRVFEDKASGRAGSERPALNEMLAYVRDGDRVRVSSMDRLARSLVDLTGIVDDLVARGISVEFVKEALRFEASEMADAFGRFQLHVLGAVAEFERSLIRERQREGIALAKQRGAYTGRSPVLTSAQVSEMRSQVAAGVPKAAVARRHGVSRATVYKALGDAYRSRDAPEQ